MPEKIPKHLAKLAKGIVCNSVEQVYREHSILYGIGQLAVPYIEDLIFEQSWGNIHHGTQLNLLTGMLNLISDIDEESASQVAERLFSCGVSQTVKTRIASILNYKKDNFLHCSYQNLDLRFDKQLEKPEKVISLFKGWLRNIPSEHLKGINRIYITKQSSEDYAGLYIPILSNITVEWVMWRSYYNPFIFLDKQRIEKTLYHEVGHHSLRHRGGYCQEQEDQADDFAKVLMRKSHPIWLRIAKLLRPFLVRRKRVS